ncbi:MAG: tRNA pseudouridine(13) synthase TruD [Phycisphaerales bacterium]|nr:tRNA pseudouridine(13) synthase TruD [Phycisphaerales bacterium]
MNTATWLTADIPGIGGRIKERPEDFLVDEAPLYQPSGKGEHIYMLIEKRGLSTLHVAGLLSRHFGVRPFDVGYAGLKDKRAITRQVFSVHTPGKHPEDFPAISHDRIGVLWTDLHGNKLRRGHLIGNRFSIKVRGVPPTAAITALRTFRQLAESGVPNRIGPQRFGYLGRNHLIGRALLLGDEPGVLDALLAPAPAGVPDNQSPARGLYASGDFAAARDAFHRDARAERRVLSVLARGRSPSQAVRAIDPQERNFFLSAFQSAVFNFMLDGRLHEGRLAHLGTGDVAFKHDNRALFAVTDETLTDPALAGRLERFEISPSGPMWGPAMLRAGGEIDRREVAALEAAGLTPELLAAFESRYRGSMEGARRPYRVPVTDVDVEGGVDEFGGYVRCTFDLPRGAFATTVMAEIMKSGPDEPEIEDED